MNGDRGHMEAAVDEDNARALTLAEAAERLSVGLTTMKQLARKEIPVVRIGKNTIRIRVTDLNAWLASLPRELEDRS